MCEREPHSWTQAAFRVCERAALVDPGLDVCVRETIIMVQMGSRTQALMCVCERLSSWSRWALVQWSPVMDPLWTPYGPPMDPLWTPYEGPPMDPL